MPRGFEPYSDRPDILLVKPQAHPSDKRWENIKAAHFTTVALLMALYPTQDLYFLARDAEFLHDTARLIFRNDPQTLARLHLLNVSSVSVSNMHLADYLNENGISEQALKNKKIVFVDTGFKGTVPSKISSLFSRQGQSNIKTHLLLSENLDIPSTRAFLSYMDANVNSAHPSTIHSTLSDFEEYSKFTDQSTNYIKYGGRWTPISVAVRIRGGFVDRGEALELMEDLVYESQKSETSSQFLETQKLIDEILQALKSNDENKLKELLKKEPLLVESLIRDILDAQKNIGTVTNLTPEKLGLIPKTYIEDVQHKQQENKKPSPKILEVAPPPLYKHCINLFSL